MLSKRSQVQIFLRCEEERPGSSETDGQEKTRRRERTRETGQEKHNRRMDLCIPLGVEH